MERERERERVCECLYKSSIEEPYTTAPSSLFSFARHCLYAWYTSIHWRPWTHVFCFNPGLFARSLCHSVTPSRLVFGCPSIHSPVSFSLHTWSVHMLIQLGLKAPSDTCLLSCRLFLCILLCCCCCCRCCRCCCGFCGFFCCRCCQMKLSFSLISTVSPVRPTFVGNNW